MSSKDIYSILSSKPHNQHYLNRYWKFVQSFQHQIEITGVTEEHHICPKSDDLFPEYKSLKRNPWNGIHLTKRQHFIAHWILANAYKGKQIYAFWAMCNQQSPTDSRSRNYKVSSKIYEFCKNNFKKINHHSLNKVWCVDNLGNNHYVSKEEYKNNNNLYSNMKNKKSIINRYTLEMKIVTKEEYYKLDESVWVYKLCKGIYHTPYGSFSDSKKVNGAMCINNNRVITSHAIHGSMSNKNRIWLTKDMLGKTYKEVGFWFEELNLI